MIVRETTGLHPCDKRNPISVISPSFPHVDFHAIKIDEDPLYDKYIFMRESDADVSERGRQFLRWLATRDEESVIVVTHSAFLRTLFRMVLDCDDSDKIEDKNCELRSYRVSMPKC